MYVIRIVFSSKMTLEQKLKRVRVMITLMSSRRNTPIKANVSIKTRTE